MLIYGIIASEETPGSSSQGPPPSATPNKWVAVGINFGAGRSVLITSEDADATTWVDRSTALPTPASTSSMNGVCYSPELDRWVAVGWDNDVNFGRPTIVYSDDSGNTWSSATPAPTTDFFVNTVCWTGSMFITAGSDSSNSAPKVSTSPDGITWTQRTSAPTTSNLWWGVSGMSGLAVAVGGIDPFGATPHIMSSANDGASWTSRTAASGARNLNGVVVVENTGGVHVCVGFAATNGHIATSTDGTTWTSRTVPSDHALYDVAWNGSIYAAVGMDFSVNVEGRACSSPTGTTWTARTPDPAGPQGPTGDLFDGPNFLSVAARIGGGFVAVGRDNNGFNIPYMMYSADGLTWAERTSPQSGCVLLGVGSSHEVTA